MANVEKKAIIIGAGPAGLTAAYELLARTDVKPVVYEMTDSVGGIARTVEYKGNRIDIGGHRLFSKSDRIVKWWTDFLPLQGAPSIDQIILKERAILSTNRDAPDPEKTDKVMLIRKRVSRIFFLRKFLEYPISMHPKNILKLGLGRVFRVSISYLISQLFPIREEKTLEDFFINRFGKELYITLFKKYTQKIWGVPCKNIPAEWGYQRIKGLSVFKVIIAASKSIMPKKLFPKEGKDIETSLIRQFMYPKLGIGQLWEEVAKKIEEMGGVIYRNHKVIELKAKENRITEIIVRDEKTGSIKKEHGDYFISTAPVIDLIRCLGKNVPSDVKEVAEQLIYRDFITVGLILRKMKADTEGRPMRDNWIYVQERDVRLGRIQIYNNWSPYLVNKRDVVWIGLEYFCNEGDAFWNKPDDEIIKYGIKELTKLGLAERDDVLDGVVVRSVKAYPAYFGGYSHFDTIRNFTDKFKNLFLIGRNGMHRYNNMDHSVLTAMVAVDNIINNVSLKNNIWSVNTEKKYGE